MQKSLLKYFYGLIILNYRLSICLVSSSKCDRIPVNSATNKSPADGRYKLRILGDPEYYVPGENYTSKLKVLIVRRFNLHTK
jgi:hypothetical protein